MGYLILVCCTKNRLMRITACIFGLLLFFRITVAGQGKEVESIFQLIYNQEFSQAETKLKQEKNQLGQFYYTVLQVDLHWWKYSVSKSRNDARKLKELLIEITPQKISTSNDKMINLICKSYSLRYERKRYHLFGVLRLRNEINSLLDELEENDIPADGVERRLFQLYISMFRYFEKVNPLALSRNADLREKDIKRLEEFSKDQVMMVNIMAHYFLGRIYQKIEKDYELGTSHFAYLKLKFPLNRSFEEHFQDCKRKI